MSSDMMFRSDITIWMHELVQDLITFDQISSILEDFIKFKGICFLGARVLKGYIL